MVLLQHIMDALRAPRKRPSSSGDVPNETTAVSCSAPPLIASTIAGKWDSGKTRHQYTGQQHKQRHLCAHPPQAMQNPHSLCAHLE